MFFGRLFQNEGPEIQNDLSPILVRAPIRAWLCLAPWFPLCIPRYGEKQQNLLLLLIYLTARFEISKCVCFSIIVTRS